MSGILMKFLLVFYGLIAGISVAEGNWPRALYWTSAAGITFSVIWMGGGK